MTIFLLEDNGQKREEKKKQSAQLPGCVWPFSAKEIIKQIMQCIKSICSQAIVFVCGVRLSALIVSHRIPHWKQVSSIHPVCNTITYMPQMG